MTSTDLVVVPGSPPSLSPTTSLNLSLIDAVRQNDLSLTRELLDLGASPNYRDAENKTALLWATQNGHTACASALIEHGADINVEREGQTPLLTSITCNRTDCVKLLLEKGAIIDPPNSGLMGSPVEDAILLDRVDCLRMLLENGAKVDSRDTDGRTPLHNAAKYGHAECANLLLTFDADRNSKDSENMTPQDIALAEGYTNVADLIANYRPGMAVDHYFQNGQDSQMDQDHKQQNRTEIGYLDIATVPVVPPSPTPPSLERSFTFTPALSLSMADSQLSQISQYSQYSQQSQTGSQYLNPLKPPRFVNPNFEIDFSDLEILEEIGSGFYGKVCKALWQGGTPVAVKHLHVAAADGKIDDLTRRNFRLEMEMLTALRHPNVVLFLGVCIRSPNFLLVTEYMPRGSLYDVLHKSKMGKSLELRTRLRMALDVACGMNYLHKQVPKPILHRDLKSSNLLVTEDLHVKVSDFGLARVKETNTTGRKPPRIPLDVTILAPEVLRTKLYTEKSDIYSYGLLLWELLCIKIPFEGVEPQQIAQQILDQVRPPIPPELSSSVPPPLSGLMVRCWDDNPQVRPSFQEIVRELRAMVGNSI